MKNGKKKNELLGRFCLFLFLCFPTRNHSYSLKDQCPAGEGLAERFTIKHTVWEEPANRLPGKLGWSTTLKLRFEGLQSWGGGWEVGMVRNTKSEKSHKRGYHRRSWNPKKHNPVLPWLWLSPLMASLSFWLPKSKPQSQLAMSSEIWTESYCISLPCFCLSLLQKILSTFENVASFLNTQQRFPFHTKWG